MKKFLLLAALTCIMMLHTKVISAKCEPHLFYQKSSVQLWTSIPYWNVSPGFQVQLLQNETLQLEFVNSSSCYDCPQAVYWYLDDNLIESSSISGPSPIIINAPAGSYIVTTDSLGYCANWHFKWCFQIVDVTGISNLGSSSLLYPLSQLSSNINVNLQYKIITPIGQVFEQGNFSGKIVLRGQKPQCPLPSGIYFVIYYDALDNRQVLTDKVFVTNQ